MSWTEPVPETRMMPGNELSADDAFLALRHYGRWHPAPTATRPARRCSGSATPV
jgi:hypothetical protein